MYLIFKTYLIPENLDKDMEFKKEIHPNDTMDQGSGGRQGVTPAQACDKIEITF
jgi:hypothetical protein